MIDDDDVRRRYPGSYAWGWRFWRIARDGSLYSPLFSEELEPYLTVFDPVEMLLPRDGYIEAECPYSHKQVHGGVPSPDCECGIYFGRTWSKFKEIAHYFAHEQGKNNIAFTHGMVRGPFFGDPLADWDNLFSCTRGASYRAVLIATDSTRQLAYDMPIHRRTDAWFMNAIEGVARATLAADI